MDQIALRSGKAVKGRDMREDSDNDPEEGVQLLMEQGYAIEGKYELEGNPPPPKK